MTFSPSEILLLKKILRKVEAETDNMSQPDIINAKKNVREMIIKKYQKKNQR